MTARIPAVALSAACCLGAHPAPVELLQLNSPHPRPLGDKQAIDRRAACDVLSSAADVRGEDFNRAIEMVRSSGGEAGWALPCLIRALRADASAAEDGIEYDGDPDALSAIVSLGGVTVSGLAELLSDKSQLLRTWAATALKELGPAAAPAVPSLSACASRDKQEWPRRCCIEALGETRDPRAVPALTRALESESAEVVLAAVVALGEIGPDAGATLTRVREVTRRLWGEDLPPGARSAIESIADEDPQRKAARLGLAARSGSTAALLQLTAMLLAAKGDIEMIPAANELRRVGEAAVPLLTQGLRSRESQLNAIFALASLGPRARPALPLLEPLMDDPCVPVETRNTAREAIARINGDRKPDSPPVFWFDYEQQAPPPSPVPSP